MATGFQGRGNILKPIQWYKALHDHHGRQEINCFLVNGIRAIEQIYSVSPTSIEEILTLDESIVDKFDCPTTIVSQKQMERISPVKTPQNVVAVIAIPENIYSSELPVEPGKKILCLEHIQDPGNVGTLIRTAAAFDYDGIIMSELCADPLGIKTAQATAGSLFSVWIRRTKEYVSLCKDLQSRNFVLYSTDMKGDKVTNSLQLPHIIALGNEGNGLSELLTSIADKRVRIPINDQKVESLNVAISGAILMYLSHT